MRWTIKGRHAGLAIDVAAAGTLAAAIGFAMGAATADIDLACSAATIAFMLVLAGLRNVEPSAADRAMAAVGPASGEPAAAPRGEVVQLASASRHRDLACYIQSGPSEAAADASQALSDALAELRRSLR